VTGTDVRAETRRGRALQFGLTLLALLFVSPLVWLTATSLLPKDAILSANPLASWREVSFSNFSRVVGETTFPRTLANSLIVSSVVTLVGVYIGTLGGYAFAKLKFPGRNVLFAAILATLSIPALVTVIPNFLVMSRLGLIGSLWSVILPQLTPPLAIFWMRQYISRSISDELLEAARLDGAGEFRIMHSLVLPLCTPGMAGLAVWLFMTSWNALLIPLAYMQDSSKATFPVFLTSLMSFNAVPQTDLVVAASVISLIPPLVVFALAQRRFVSGLVEGSVKG
jgi:ABC-type glycerol-3-phosphate transport system permease component